MSLLLALLAPAQATCSLALTGDHHVLPGDDIEITWSGAADHTEVYVSAFSSWGEAYHLTTVTPNDGHLSWTLPADLDHRDTLHLYVESATNGSRSTECWAYQEVDVAHTLDIGFAKRRQTASKALLTLPRGQVPSVLYSGTSNCWLPITLSA